jgi:simple sugar transport system permease protein
MERLWRTKKSTILLTAGAVVALYVFWFVDHTKAESMLTSAWGFAVPLILAALVGVVGERSGVVNIGIEGQMLISAFAAFFGAALTGSLLLGVLFGLGAGMVLGGFLAWTAVKWQTDQIIAGVVINIVATGITSFYYKQGQTLPGVFPRWEIPLLKDLPLVGKVFFANGPFALATILIVFVLSYLLFRTRWGLRTRAIGEYPQAADTAGIDVIRMRLVNVTLAGLLAGAAGAFLSMEASSTFERGITADRGFLALAIMIFGAWKPLQAAAAALFFGFAQAIASQLQADKVVDIPQQLINTLPYVLTLIVLAVAAGRVRAPAAEGVPFVKGQG